MKDTITVAIVAAPEAEAGVILGIYDAFWSVGRLWNMVNGEEPAPRFSPVVVGADRSPFHSGTGFPITPEASVDDLPRPDIVFVPSLLIHSGKRFADANPLLLDWVRSAYGNGSRIVSSCTGSFLLAEIGLLDGKEATTHWAFTRALQEEYPDVRVQGDRIIVSADPDGRVVTAGGASSWTDLTLYLVGRFAGSEEARRLARVSLFDWHHQGQTPYARLNSKAQVYDRTVAQAQEWLATHYDSPDPVASIVAASGVAERTFNRRFRSATGMSPLNYTQTLRVEEAKQLLETTAAPVDEIARSVGYEDPGAFRRVFKRLVGETPREYRRRTSVPEAIRKLPD
ncbi:MAG: helix-turn-helix domain-containing protein [Pseudomonadota bacterium]